MSSPLARFHNESAANSATLLSAAVMPLLRSAHATMRARRTPRTAWSAAATFSLRAPTKNLLRRLASWQFQRRWLQRDDRRYFAVCDELEAKKTIRDVTAVLSERAACTVLEVRSPFACSALNARSNDCHVGLLCMTQRAQYRTQMWVRTLCVVVRTDFLCYPVHFQHTT